MYTAAEHDDLQAGILRLVEYNTSEPQLDAVRETVVVENQARVDVDPGTVRDALATLVEEGALERETRTGDVYYRRP